MKQLEETKTFFFEVCVQCTKKIKGHTEGEVKMNMGRHKGSLACKQQQRKNKLLENNK